MPPQLSRILGWSPPDNKEYVDVTVSSNALLPPQNPTFHISDPNPIQDLRRAGCEKLEFSSPPSSPSAFSTDADSFSEKRVESNGKNTDPSWVARPRNEFILFRCDYVRKHSHEGKRIRRTPETEVGKSLSKQAADAWHHLPPQERLYWKERANGERNEHARRYPNYRYRPKKNAARRRRQTRSSPNRVRSPDNVSSTPTSSSAISVSSSSPSAPSPSLTDYSANGNTRSQRASSVPGSSITDPVTHRRLRSTASQSWNATEPSPTTDFLYSPIPLRLQDSPSYTPVNHITFPTPQSSTAMQITTSSLLNWKEEGMVHSTPQSTKHISSTSEAMFSGMDIASGPLLKEFTSGGDPLPYSELFSVSDNANYHQNCDIWMPQLHDYPIDDVTWMNDAMGSETFAVQGYFPVHHRTANSIMDSEGQAHRASLVDYGMNRADCDPVDLLGCGSSPSFCMDTDDLWFPI